MEVPVPVKEPAMRTKPGLAILLLISVVAVREGACVAAAGMALERAPRQAEARRARSIGRALEDRRVAEALREAESAVRRYPASSLLRLRLAQSHLSRAVQLDGELEQTL